MAAERLRSLDAFRGATIAGMIVVNDAGDWEHVYRQLEHAAWDGCTLTDLVFPFFVFIMGVSVPLARRDELWPIVRRTILLFCFGLLLSAFPFNLEGPPRIPGVLQRIAVCYLVSALLARRASSAALAGIALGLLVSYGGAVLGDLTPEGNLGARVDRAVLGTGHLYRHARWDPEGILSTLPAIATALSGVLAGRWITDASRSPSERASGLFAAGLPLVALGLALDAVLPINKNLWSASYVLFTSGLACQALAFSYHAIDVHGWRAWAAPLVPFGRNAIFAYMLSGLLARLLVFGIVWQTPEGKVCAKTWLYEHLFATSTCLTSLLWALGYTAIIFAAVLVLDWRKVYLKV